ncbi:MAG: hypothetical protein WA869_29725 [Alloacidobacterium sp.]
MLKKVYVPGWAPKELPHLQILTDEPERHLVNGNKPDLATLAVDAEVNDAFAALQVLEA